MRRPGVLLISGAVVGAALALGLVAAFGGFNSGNHPRRDVPVLAFGVAPVKGGQVEAYLHDPPADLKVGQSWRPPEIGTAPIDDSGNFEIRVDPTRGPVARELRKNGGFINVELHEGGADGKYAVTTFPRTLIRGRWTDNNGLKVNPKYEVVVHG